MKKKFSSKQLRISVQSSVSLYIVYVDVCACHDFLKEKRNIMFIKVKGLLVV